MSYSCGKCLKQVFVSSTMLHTHKKVCTGLASKKSAGDSSGGGGDASRGASSKGTPKKDGNAPTDSQSSSTAPATCSSPRCSGREASHSKDLKESSGGRKKKKKDRR